MEKKKANPLKHEIKRILMGYSVKDEKDRLIVSEETMKHLGRGVSDGATGVAILGVSKRKRRYVRSSNKKELNKKIEKAMDEMGRRVFLSEKPEAPACLVRSIILRPSLIFFNYEEDEAPAAVVYTGRGLFSFLAKKKAFKELESRLGDSLMREVDKQKKEKKEAKEKEKNEAAKKEEIQGEIKVASEKNGKTKGK